MSARAAEGQDCSTLSLCTLPRARIGQPPSVDVFYRILGVHVGFTHGGARRRNRDIQVRNTNALFSYTGKHVVSLVPADTVLEEGVEIV